MPNLVPYDKFYPQTIKKAVKYIRALARIDPDRLKYANKKSLKGKDICNKLAPRDPFSGIVPPMMADPDLQNTYSIIGICGITRRLTPVRYRITELAVDAVLFAPSPPPCSSSTSSLSTTTPLCATLPPHPSSSSSSSVSPFRSSSSSPQRHAAQRSAQVP